MKKIFLLLALVIGIKIGFGQNVIQYTPQYIEKQYVPQHDYQMLQNALQARQTAYDANKKYLYSIQNWILDAKSEHPNSSQLKILDKYYAKLDDMKDEDLSLAGNQLQEIALLLKKELIESQTKTNTLSSNGKLKKIKSLCVIFSEPTYNSEQLASIAIGQHVEFIESTDILWCKVRSNNIVGYTLKSNLILK